ncbi:hypothetical protein FB451DRAFT_1170204 [Mycena latifolia]|nr:hypothetical protein FB451DRAFT_1170204 [Mycena latifolia]
MMRGVPSHGGAERLRHARETPSSATDPECCKGDEGARRTPKIIEGVRLIRIEYVRLIVDAAAQSDSLLATAERGQFWWTDFAWRIRREMKFAVCRAAVDSRGRHGVAPRESYLSLRSFRGQTGSMFQGRSDRSGRLLRNSRFGRKPSSKMEDPTRVTEGFGTIRD